MFDVDLYRPPLSATGVAIIAAVAVLLPLALYAARQSTASWPRRVLLVTLRLCALAAVVWILAGPSILEGDNPQTLRVPVVVLVDTSASMGESDEQVEGQNVTRWQALQQSWLREDYLRDLAAAADVSVRAFDEQMRVLDPQHAREATPEGRQTRLVDAVREAASNSSLTSRPGGVLLLLSDGHDTGDVMDPAVTDRLREQGIRLFAGPVGEASNQPDLAVQAWAEADFLFSGQSTAIHAAIHQRGLSDAQARVELVHQGRRIATETVSLASGGARRVTFDVTPPEPSDQAIEVQGYEVRATLMDAQGVPTPNVEPFLANNQRQVFVQVSRERVRVALFEGEPYWETRFLARLLHADPQIEFTAVYHVGSGRRVEVASEQAKPLDPEALDQSALNQFDVVILGKRAERFFPGAKAAMLADFVRQRGGALVLARGQAFSVDTTEGREATALLGSITPVEWGDQQVRDLGLRLTAEGRQSPLLSFEELASTDAVLTELPGMLAATRVEREKAASVVLLRQAASRGSAGGEAMAAVAYTNAGRGRVLAVLTDGLWRWGMLPHRQEQYVGVYQLFWSRSIQWLATGGEFLPGQQVSLSLSRVTAKPDDVVEVRVSTRYVAAEAFAPMLRVVGPGGTVEEITPTRDTATGGTYTATLRPQEQGIYRIELTAPDHPELIAPEAPLVSRLAVEDPSLELADTSARPEVLEALAEATGGECLATDQRHVLLQHLQQVQQARLSDVRPTYDFARGGVFAIIVGCLVGEWLLRRRGGLL